MRGLVGPAFFIAVTFLWYIAGLSGKLPPAKLLLIAAGVALVFLGGRR